MKILNVLMVCTALSVHVFAQTEVPQPQIFAKAFSVVAQSGQQTFFYSIIKEQETFAKMVKGEVADFDYTLKIAALPGTSSNMVLHRDNRAFYGWNEMDFNATIADGLTQQQAEKQTTQWQNMLAKAAQYMPAETAFKYITEEKDENGLPKKVEPYFFYPGVAQKYSEWSLKVSKSLYYDNGKKLFYRVRLEMVVPISKS